MEGGKDKIWDAYYRSSFVYDPRRDTVWKGVCAFLQRRYIPPDSRILDAGAGYCNFINNIEGKEKFATDVMVHLREYAAEGVRAFVQSCTKLDFLGDDSLDVIFASNLLEHLTREDLFLTMEEFRRVLRIGGIVILLQPNFRYCYREYFDDYTHLQVFTDRSLPELLQGQSFEIVDVIPRFLPVNMKTTLRITLPKIDWIVRTYLHLPYKPLARQMLVVGRKKA